MNITDHAVMLTCMCKEVKSFKSIDVQLIVVCLSGSALYYYNYVCTQLVTEVFVDEKSINNHISCSLLSSKD